MCVRVCVCVYVCEESAVTEGTVVIEYRVCVCVCEGTLEQQLAASHHVTVAVDQQQPGNNN